MSDKKYIPPEVVIKKGDIVFIDTCIFDSFKYSFESQYFKSLATHRAALDFLVVVSAVVEKEVLSHILRDFTNLETTASKFDDQVGSDYASDFTELISSLKQKAGETRERVLTAWAAFKEVLGVVVLPYELVTMQDVFDRYFDVKPPFDAKTKSEIPDAFSAIAIEKFQAQHGSGQVVVISTDGIFSKCETIYPNWFVFKRLQDFLESVVRNQPAQTQTVVVATSIPSVLVPPPPVVVHAPPVFNLNSLPVYPQPPVVLPGIIDPLPGIDGGEVEHVAEETEAEDVEWDEDELKWMRDELVQFNRVVTLNKAEIEQAISDSIEGLAFEVHGEHYYDDEQVSVSSVELQSFRVDEINMEDQRARIAVDIVLDAEAHYSCSVWDSVDREYIYLDSSADSIGGEYSGFIEVSFEDEALDVEDVEFEALNHLEIRGELPESFYQ